MGVVSNLITGRTNDFLGGIGSWQSYGAPHSLVPSREEILYSNLGSLKVTALSSSPIQMTHPNISVGEQYDWLSRAFYWVYSNEPLQATVGIVVYNTTTESASVSVSVRARRWTLISIDGPYPEQGARLQMHIRLDGLPNGDSAYITNPTLLTPDAISRNVFAAESWLRLPQYLQEVDEVQEVPNFPLLRFMDVLTSSLDDLYVLWNDLRYIPPDDEGGPKISALDPSISTIETLRWLAQLLGIQFYDPSSGTTPWIYLEEGVDLDGDGPEWSEWETVPDTGDIGTDVSWAEIEGFSPSITGLIDLMRWQVQTAYYGLRGGTKQAVLDSAKKALSGTKYAVVLEPPASPVWTILLQTKQSETPDNPGLGDSSQSVLDVVANAVPAGFELVHETIAG